MPDPMLQPTPASPPRARRWLRRLGAPGVALGLLLGVGLQQGSYPRPVDFSDYHRTVAVAVAGVPLSIGDWVGQEIPVPQPALDLLDPNALRNILFTDFGPASLHQPDRRVSLLIVQCRAASDMGGHYPPQCYPGTRGAELVEAPRPRSWVVPAVPPPPPGDPRPSAVRIDGMEYHFVEPSAGPGVDLPGTRRSGEARAAWRGPTPGRTRRLVVLNFMVVPGVGIVRDIKGVQQAAEDYKRRHRGAAQVQLVFDPGSALPDEAERDRILAELLGPLVPVLQAIAHDAPLPPADPHDLRADALVTRR